MVSFSARAEDFQVDQRGVAAVSRGGNLYGPFSPAAFDDAFERADVDGDGVDLAAFEDERIDVLAAVDRAGDGGGAADDDDVVSLLAPNVAGEGHALVRGIAATVELSKTLRISSPQPPSMLPLTVPMPER